MRMGEEEPLPIVAGYELLEYVNICDVQQFKYIRSLLTKTPTAPRIKSPIMAINQGSINQEQITSNVSSNLRKKLIKCYI